MASGILVALLAGLVGCQPLPTRTATPPVPTETNVDPLRETIGSTVLAPPQPSQTNGIHVPDALSQNDLWKQMREGFALPGCDYTPGIREWINRYAASPSRFASTLADMLPALDYTHRQLREAGLPSEFALLPIVESHYRPYPAADDRPAGVWQMMGSTARSAGLTVDKGFDGRLNLAAATDSAIALLNRYGDHFNSDWRLVAFAYNAGEYRVRRAVQKHEPGQSFDSLYGLGLSEISYEYLTKLLALSCLIREPERFDLELPTLENDRRLVRLDLEGVIGRSLLRALSGMEEDEFDRYNGGLRGDRTRPDDRLPLLATNVMVEQVDGVIEQLPDRYRTDWKQHRLQDGESLQSLASSHDLPEQLLFAINRYRPASGDSPASVWLPGRSNAGTGSTSTQQTPPSSPATASRNVVHLVRPGDNAWNIARRNGITVKQLLRYNGLSSSRLRPGQRLRLAPP